MKIFAMLAVMFFLVNSVEATETKNAVEEIPMGSVAGVSDQSWTLVLKFNHNSQVGSYYVEADSATSIPGFKSKEKCLFQANFAKQSHNASDAFCIEVL